MIYASTAGLISILPQVFWPDHSSWAAGAVPEHCATGLRQLKAELLTRASDRVAMAGHPDAASLDRWLRGWDDRYIALEKHCEAGPEGRAHATLGRLRHHTGTFLRKFDREEGRIARQLNRELQALPQDSEESR
jgi:hypothetical protein